MKKIKNLFDEVIVDPNTLEFARDPFKRFGNLLKDDVLEEGLYTLYTELPLFSDCLNNKQYVENLNGLDHRIPTIIEKNKGHMLFQANVALNQLNLGFDYHERAMNNYLQKYYIWVEFCTGPVPHGITLTGTASNAHIKLMLPRPSLKSRRRPARR